MFKRWIAVSAATAASVVGVTAIPAMASASAGGQSWSISYGHATANGTSNARKAWFPGWYLVVNGTFSSVSTNSAECYFIEYHTDAAIGGTNDGVSDSVCGTASTTNLLSL